MPSQTPILLAAALLTSILSGTLGMGGGILLLAVMAQYFPLAVLIPLHGLVQLGSNSSRTLYHFRAINRKMFALYVLGSVVGAALGSRVVLHIPEGWYKLGLGIFILIVTFVKLPIRPLASRFKWPLIGAGSTFLSLIMGATGPLIAPFFLSEKLSRQELIATKASCQAVTHLLKVLAFFLLGFVVGPYLPVLLGMVAMVFLGNYLGKIILHRTSERWFRLLFKVLIVVLSLRMFWLGIHKI